MKRKIDYILLPFGIYAVYILLANTGLFFLGEANGVVLTVFIDLIMSLLCYAVIHKCLSDKQLNYSARPVSSCKPVFWLCMLIAAYFIGQCAASAIYAKSGDVAYDAYASELGSASAALYVVLVLFIAPVYEELFFRGIIYRSVKQVVPPLAAGAISALVFALSHGTLIHMVPTFLIGFLSCVMYEYTNRLLFSILLHMANNLLSVVVSGIELPDLLFQPLFLVLCIGLFIAVISVLFLSNSYHTLQFYEHPVEKPHDVIAVGDEAILPDDDIQA